MPIGPEAQLGFGCFHRSDLPLEVIALFGVIVVVGILGLIKSNGGLSGAAPTVGLGDSREDFKEEAAAVQGKSLEDMTQAEKEALYFKEIAGDLATKRGGSKTTRKKNKKKK